MVARKRPVSDLGAGLLSEKDKAEIEKRAAVRRQLNADIARESIQVSSLIKVLQDHALGKGRTKMTPAKLKAIELLLDKSMPSLSSVKAEVEAKSVNLTLTTLFTKTEEPKA